MQLAAVDQVGDVQARLQVFDGTRQKRLAVGTAVVADQRLPMLGGQEGGQPRWCQRHRPRLGQVVGTAWTDVVIFSLLVLVLVFRPAGLLGRLAPNKS